MAMTSLFTGGKLKLVTMFPVGEETWKQVFLEPSAPASRLLFQTGLSTCAATSPVALSQALHKTHVLWYSAGNSMKMLLDIRAALFFHMWLLAEI